MFNIKLCTDNYKFNAILILGYVQNKPEKRIDFGQNNLSIEIVTPLGNTAA